MMRPLLLALVVLFGLTAPALAQEPPQILIVPLSGPPEPANRLGDAMERAVTAIGAEPVSAQASRSDIAALTGCPRDDIACYQTVAETIEVDHVAVGSVESRSDGTYAVELLLIEPEGEPRRRTVALRSREPEAQSAEFEAHARAFLAGEPPPSFPPPDPPDATPVEKPEPVATGSGFSLGRVEPYSWGVAGGGVALLGLGGALLFAAQDKQDEVDSAPTDTVADLERLRDLEDSGESFTRWGNVALIAGGIATAAGIALVVKQAGTSPGEPPAASVAPTPVAGGLGLSITLRGDL